jgi:RNA polymerase sigma-70 factor (ECF subfamily)
VSEKRMGETKERLEQIFRDYYQLIYRVAFSQVKNHADAEDITQEVFLKIIRHDMRYQSMEHERAWIVRVTINLCRDLLKSKWHKTSVSMEEVSEAQRGSCENFTEIQDDMMWAVLQLPEKYRNCLYLFYYEDYSIKEIAQSLEMPENTVKTNLKRGRQALKEFLEK